MNRIETNFPLVHVYDGVIDLQVCKQVTDFMFSKTLREDGLISPTTMPWQDHDTLAWNLIDDRNIKKHIETYRITLTQIVGRCFGTIVYPHFTDLVVWRTGRRMEFHKDNGYENDGNEFKPRVFSSVTYLNDEFEGGETVVKNDYSEYENKPKAGSVLIFTSDERCTHKVNQVISGVRVTLPIWFATDIRFFESAI